MNAWLLCVDYSDGKPINASHCQATMDHFGIIANRRIPEHVLRKNRVQKAAGALAAFGDGEKLADEIGVNGFGKDWSKAVDVVMDAEQERMNLNAGK
jgi:hypothetical protein